MSRQASGLLPVRCWSGAPGACDRANRKAKAKGRKRKRLPAGGRREHRAPGEPTDSPVARKYLIETFGCQMNAHDSERMAGLLEQAGFEATEHAADADVVVIHTCSGRERAAA